MSLAQDKHGLENFTKTILFYCYNREEMNLLEHCVVTPGFCAREDTYNMMQGGDGGWSYVNLSSDYAAGSMKRHDAMVRANNDPVAKEQRARSTKATISNWSEERRQQHLLAVSRGVRKFKEEHPSYMVGENNPMHGRKMPEWAKRKMSSSHMGSKNPMHGYAWVCN